MAHLAEDLKLAVGVKEEELRARAETERAKAEGESARRIRKEAMNQFMVTLSDQQLVTGLAILLAGVSNQKGLSGYEFTVILSLAWFSSTTHLATLTTLRSYFRKLGRVRDLRALGMLCVLGLLFYVLYVSFMIEESRVPVQCVFSGEETAVTPVSNASDAELNTVLQIVASIYTFILILLAYLSCIISLYGNSKLLVLAGQVSRKGKSASRTFLRQSPIPWVTKHEKQEALAIIRVEGLSRVQRARGVETGLARSLVRIRRLFPVATSPRHLQHLVRHHPDRHIPLGGGPGPGAGIFRYGIWPDYGHLPPPPSISRGRRDILW